MLNSLMLNECVCMYAGKWVRKASALYLTILQVLLNSAPPCFPCRGHVVKESRGARLPFVYVSKHFYLFIAPAMKSISQVLLHRARSC